MKSTLKIGDKVVVTKGKYLGKEDKILACDKKNNRIRLEVLKKQPVKTKKGAKEIHGTFHVSSLKLIAPEKPKEVEKTPVVQGQNAEPPA